MTHTPLPRLTRFLFAALLVVVTPTVAWAQLGSVPYSFSSGTVIASAQVNTNFSTIYSNALNRTGGTMTGTLTLSGTAANIILGSNYVSGDGDDEGISIDASGVVTISSLSLTTLTCTGCVGATQIAATAVSAASYGGANSIATFTVDADGRLTAAAGVTPQIPISTGVTGLGTGVATALGVNTGSAGAVVLFNGAGGTPSSLTLTNATGLPETAITDGALLARLAANETVTGAWTFAAKPTFSFANGSDYTVEIAPTTSATPYGLNIKEPTTPGSGYPLFSVSNNAGTVNYFRVDSSTGKGIFAGPVEIVNVNGTNELVFTGTDATNILSATTSVMQVGTTSTGAFSVLTNNTERMAVTSGGLFGFGRSNAGATFHEFRESLSVHSTSGAAVYLYGGGSGNTQMFSFRELGTYVNIGSVQNIYLGFMTDNTENLRLTADGHVAINTAKRHYWDGVAATGNTYTLESSADTLVDVVGGVTTFERTAGAIKVLGTEAGTATLYIWADEGDDAEDKFRLTSAGDRLWINGIGTTVEQFIFTGNAAGAPYMTISDGAFGLASEGPAIIIGYNTSGSDAAGALGLRKVGGTTGWIWTDNTGVLRINSSKPVEDGGTTSDTGGTVVGTQTSTLATKTLTGHDLTPEDALSTILATPIKSFTYKSGAYNGTEFQGIIADWSPAFAMDNGKSFNPVSAFGYTVQAMKAQQAQIDALKAELAALKASR